MRKNPWITLAVLVLVFISLIAFLFGSSAISLFGKSQSRISGRNSILHLQLDGVIITGKKFLKQLEKYGDDRHVKALVVEINSPGGVVGPSQEIHAELLRLKKEKNIPVVIVSTGLLASGAYYAAVAGDHVVVAPGALVGSIGVIMEFTNLEKLYDWAKIQRYSLTTGKYKDSGAEYRALRDDERAVFQEMLNEVWEQFKAAVAEGRKLDPEFVNRYSDGRIMTGAKAVELGFADSVGTVQSAIEKAAELAKLPTDYDVFMPPKHRPGFFEMLGGAEDLENQSELSLNQVDQAIRKLLKSELSHRPLFLLPGFFE